MIFFTSDTHFGHHNIIKYTGRPFTSVYEMDEALIKNWNSVVGKNDTVYHIGDFSFRGPAATDSIISRLHGNIFLVPGNHDRNFYKHGKIRVLPELSEVYINDSDAHRGQQRIVLCHYALRVWNKRHHGAWHLYGHSHGSLLDDPASRSFDVGVDCWNYTPVSYTQVKEKMLTKINVPVDHHREENDNDHD